MYLVAWFCSISKKTSFILFFLSNPPPSFSSSNLVNLRWSSSSEIFCYHCSVFYLAEEAIVFFISFHLRFQDAWLVLFNKFSPFGELLIHILSCFSHLCILYLCCLYVTEFPWKHHFKVLLDIFRFPSNFYFRKITVLCRCCVSCMPDLTSVLPL